MDIEQQENTRTAPQWHAGFLYGVSNNAEVLTTQKYWPRQSRLSIERIINDKCARTLIFISSFARKDVGLSILSDLHQVR